MLNLTKVFKSERLIKSLTGLSLSKFIELESTFLLVYKKQKILSYKGKIRAQGGGRPSKLEDIRVKLFYILFYLKCYPTFDLASFLFDADRSQCCRWSRELLPVLEETLDRELVLPKRKINNIEEFTRLFPAIKDIFVDATERPTARPSKRKRERKHYSGKKKRHTKKNIVVTTQEQQILIVTKTKSGSQHDMKILRKSGLPECFPASITVWVDTGFQGLDKETQADVEIPKKKSKNKPLSKEDKQNNKIISGLRVTNEQAIGGMKRLRSITDVSRNRDDKFVDDLIINAAGIWNFYKRTA